MNTTLFVISDQHLGGSPAGNGEPGFEMCPAPGRARLVEFLRYVTLQRSAARPVHLVIAGDLVDFLAEREFAAFTSKDGEARKKLSRIIERTEPVWEALEALVRSGVRLTILLGNHDLELSLPGPRQLLLERLGPGLVEFIYDNQAFTDGEVLVEHGNRYDSWNVVSHDGLRVVRSALSRRGTVPSFEAPAGSYLVERIMNQIKARYSFVDLLKPENAAVFPILAVLHPASLSEIRKLGQLWRRQRKLRYTPDGQPVDHANIAAESARVGRDEALLALASELGGEGDAANIADLKPRDFFELYRVARASERDTQLRRLYRALRAREEETWRCFDVGDESDDYLVPARTAVARGARVVVMGHTHLAKRVPIGETGAVYLNSGTWADLMRVPDSVLKGDEPTALDDLRRFVEDLDANRLEGWRRQVPTFVRIELDEGRLLEADVHIFGEGGAVRPVQEGSLTELIA